MNIGMSLLLWTNHVTEKERSVLVDLKRMGYDSVEIPLFNLDVKYYEWLGRELDNLGLLRTAVTSRGRDDNPIDINPSVREQALKNNLLSIDCCQALGARLLGGIYHSAFNVLSGQSPTEREWEWSIQCMRKTADYAASKNISLSIEFINRFENYLLNTSAETMRYAQEVGATNCGILYDTFHAHIEESNVYESLSSAAIYINHIQISENNRGLPGSGAVNWKDFFKFIREYKPQIGLTVEAFSHETSEIIGLTKAWKKDPISRERLAVKALQFIHAHC